MNTFIRQTLIVALLTLTLAVPVLAQGTVPERVSVSARMVDTAGLPVSGAHDVVFGLFDVDVGGVSRWSESRTGVSFTSDGLFNLELGANTPLTSTILDGQRLYLQLTIDGTPMNPRIPIVSVPYALRATTAATAARVGTLAPTDLQRRVSASCGTGEAIRVVNDDGSVSCQSTGGTYTAGTGISIAGTTLSVNTTAIQARVSGTCAVGSSIRTIAADGTVTCEADDNATYGTTANGGLVLASGNFGMMSCVTGQVLKAGATAGSWACAADVDTNTIYSALAGGGLTLNGSNQFSTDATVARKDTASGNQQFNGGTLFLDYLNNRVGINDITPAEALDVNGVAQATSFRFRTPRTDALAVAAVNFVPEPGVTTVNYTSSGYMYLANAAIAGAGLYAPVVLPDGASITGLTCYQYDNSANDIITSTASLRYRTSLSTTATEIAAAASPTSGTSTSIRTFTAPAFAAHIVNTDNQYFLVYSMVVNPAADSNTRFYGCRVIFSVPGPT